MGTRVDVKTSHQRKYITFPFEFLGNLDNCKVCLCEGSRGDGEISTGHGGRRYASLRANVTKHNEDYLRFTFTYVVWEDLWNSKKNRDAIYFTKVLYYSVRGMHFVDSVTNDNQKIITEQFWNLDPQGEVFYKDYYKTDRERHGFMSVEASSYPNENIACSWLPIDKLRFKIDDGGNELRGKGNIGVKGEVKLYINLVKNVKTITQEDDPIITQESGIRRKGSYSKVESIPDCMRTTLCYGYDITEPYASTNGLTKPILDLDALNEDKHLERRFVDSYKGATYKGSSVKELNKERERKLNIKMSANLMGFSFSQEAEKTYSETRHEKYGYNYLNIIDSYNYDTYRINHWNSPNNLHAYLNEEFLRDLKKRSADDIVKLYGTHVLLGGVQGARLNYDMRHRSSIIEHSEAKTFTSSTSFGFSRSGDSQLKPKDDEKGESNFAKAFKEAILEVVTNEPTSADLLNIVKISEEYAKIASNAGVSKPTPSGGMKISAGVSYHDSYSSSSRTEEESTEINCDGVGGDAYLCKMVLNDSSAFQRWLESIKPEKLVWCDFVPNTIVPIYLFIPSGYPITAQDVKDASDRYILTKRVEQDKLGESDQPYRVELKDGRKCFNFAKESGRNEDPELSSQRNKTTGWRLKLELVNLPERHIGVAVWFNVAEGGFHSGRSELQFRDVVDVSYGLNCNCAIKKGRNVWESREFSIRGQHHGWIDVTDYLKDCPYISFNDRVYIKIDGKGDDYNNIGIEATFKVPYIFYND